MRNARTLCIRVGGFLAAVSLAAIIASCASAPAGPQPPTAKISFTSIPPGAIVTINQQRLGATPTSANIEIEPMSGELVYPVNVRFEFESAAGGRGGFPAANLEWPTGRIPSASVTYANGRAVASDDAAPRNPEGTKLTVGRY